VPPEWRDDALAEKWRVVREARRAVTGVLETARAAGEIGSSLQAAPVLHLPPGLAGLLDEGAWAEVCITSGLTVAADGPEEGFPAEFAPAPGAKCARCWRVLPEVGGSAAHPALCLRCEAVVEALEPTPAAA
jgi:isoleucyl-tRNA synthetase